MNRTPVRIYRWLKTVFVTVAAVLSFQVQAVEETATVAVSGYDVVSYFSDSEARRGSTDHFAQHDGQTYLFASKANKDAFTASPDKYLPQYGGYCAMGMALGRKFPVDPEAWKIESGKLYLNLSKGIQQKWLEDVPGNISAADANWPTLRSVAAAELK